MCVTSAGHSVRFCRSLSSHKHRETGSDARSSDGRFRTVGLSLKFHPPPLLCTARGGKTNRSTCIKRSSQRWCVRTPPSIVHKLLTLWKVGIQDSTPTWTLSLRFFFFFFLYTQKGFLLLSRLIECGNMQLSVRCSVAVCLTLLGYLGEVYAGTVLMNSNAIKNVPGVLGVKGADTVSPSPRTSPSHSAAHKPHLDNIQVSFLSPVRKSSQTVNEYVSVTHLFLSLLSQHPGACMDDEDCGGDEFCNDARGACLPCRKSRKRCSRDAMCCAGTRCINGKKP